MTGMTESGWEKPHTHIAHTAHKYQDSEHACTVWSGEVKLDVTVGTAVGLKNMVGIEHKLKALKLWILFQYPFFQLDPTSWVNTERSIKFIEKRLTATEML